MDHIQELPVIFFWTPDVGRVRASSNPPLAPHTQAEKMRILYLFPENLGKKLGVRIEKRKRAGQCLLFSMHLGKKLARKAVRRND